jgi:hypothetical protein
MPRMPKKVMFESKYGIILPGIKSSPGNDVAFAAIRKGLWSRGVVWYERYLRAVTVFWLHGSEVSKLPEDLVGVHSGNYYLNCVSVGEKSHRILQLDSFLALNRGEDICCPAET